MSTPTRFDPASEEVTATFWVGVPALRAAYEMDGDRIRYDLGDDTREIWGVTARIVTTILLTNPNLQDALSPD